MVKLPKVSEETAKKEYKNSNKSIQKKERNIKISRRLLVFVT